MAAALAGTGPKPIVVSPLRRTRETAAALESVWNSTATVDPTVGEIPSPTDDLGGRGAWLRQVMRGRWSDLDDDYQQWRKALLDAVRSLDRDTIVVTHFVAINVVAGAALDDDRLVLFAPDYCSRTTIDVDPTSGATTIVELGAQAQTVVR
jgi:broad specificity phosphatase PhoE